MQANIKEIIEGYRKGAEDQVWELVHYVIRDRDRLNLEEVRLRCEAVASQIAEFERKAKKALGLFSEVADGSGNMAQN